MAFSPRLCPTSCPSPFYCLLLPGAAGRPPLRAEARGDLPRPRLPLHAARVRPTRAPPTSPPSPRLTAAAAAAAAAATSRAASSSPSSPTQSWGTFHSTMLGEGGGGDGGVHVPLLLLLLPLCHLPLPPPPRSFYSACVLAGVGALHEQSILYRDLKPGAFEDGGDARAELPLPRPQAGCV